jgi:uncharacterized lipoprotein YehR (DUF1307 family)
MKMTFRNEDRPNFHLEFLDDKVYAILTLNITKVMYEKLCKIEGIKIPKAPQRYVLPVKAELTRKLSEKFLNETYESLMLTALFRAKKLKILLLKQKSLKL